jgi:hypothetical protein
MPWCGMLAAVMEDEAAEDEDLALLADPGPLCLDMGDDDLQADDEGPPRVITSSTTRTTDRGVLCQGILEASTVTVKYRKTRDIVS